MTTENDTTRGSNFVKKWGRTTPAIQGMAQLWKDIGDVDLANGNCLETFFNNQLGVDQKLKFWHCEMRQYPKLNQKAWHETTDAMNKNDEEWSGYVYPGEGCPSGMADPYFKDDPLTPGAGGIPFRIIHTRALKNDKAGVETAKMAALSFIEQDDFLREIFNWGDAGETGKWDGEDVLGIKYTKTLPTKSAIISAAKSNWFVWNNGDPIKPDKLDIAKHGVTIISDSAIRTWNWYLKHNDYKLIHADRMEEIADKFRGEPWSKPTALKSFRLDWPVMRHIEESSALTDSGMTKTIEDFVTIHLGEVTRKKFMAKVHSEVERTKTDPKYIFEGIDPHMIWETAEEKWRNYVMAVTPLGQKVDWHLDKEPDSESSTETLPPKEIISEMKTHDLKLDKLLEAIQGIQSEDSIDPKGGHRVTKSYEDIDVLRISPAPSDSLRRMQNIQMAMADPIQFSDATPAIYERTTGKLKGVAVSDDFRTIQFVGYAKTVTKDDTTFEVIAEVACKYIEEHFSGMVPPHGGNEWVTPAMLIWATGSDICTKNTEIICPDPRTITAQIRKSLETK